jgi:preprotein translocase subunit SecA
MVAEDLEPVVFEFIDDLLDEIYYEVEEKKYRLEEEEISILNTKLKEIFDLDRVITLKKDSIPTKEEVRDGIKKIIDELKIKSGEHYQEILRFFLLENLDRFWKEHLLNMDYLREGIGLRGYGQKDPKQEYKKEGFELFQEMLYLLKESTIKALTHIKFQEVSEADLQHEDQTKDLRYSDGAEEVQKTPYRRKGKKIGRNDPCPCGSGKKYKKCCGRYAR